MELYGLATKNEVLRWVYDHGVRPLFLCVTGSHMWNLARPDSDLDIRGIYAERLNRVLALKGPRDTIEGLSEIGGKVDLQLYEVEKALRMLHRGNGNMVEMLLAPTRFFATEDVDWTSLARRHLTRELARYYRGYFHSQRRRAGQNRGSKALVYTYREIMAGICLMRTGTIVYDFHALYEWFRHNYRPCPLLTAFMSDPGPVGDERMREFEKEWEELVELLNAAEAASELPADVDNYEELNRTLLMQRLWAPKVRVEKIGEEREA